MTRRLYYDNAYLTEFDAYVTTCNRCEGGYQVTLDQSAFYPTSGGQPYDLGTLGSARILDVEVDEAGDVLHKVGEPLAVGSLVHGSIQWARRFDHMCQHCADHMIAGVLHRLFHAVTIGLHISADISTIDVSFPDGRTALSEDEISTVEDIINAQIREDLPVHCFFPTEEELSRLPLRKEPTVKTHIRVVGIGHENDIVEMVACGGTHPSTTGQIGLIKIIDTAPARGKMRISFLAGERAYNNYRSTYNNVHAAAALFSTRPEELSRCIKKLQESFADKERRISLLQKELRAVRLPELLALALPVSGDAKLIKAVLPENTENLRELASELVAQENIIVLLANENGDLVFARSKNVSRHMGQLLSDSARKTGGKGGGRPDFAQGKGSAQTLEIAYAELIEK